MLRPRFYGILIVFFLSWLVVAGSRADTQKLIRPDFGSRCGMVEDEIRAETPPPNNPPPAVASDASGRQTQTAPQPIETIKLFSLDQLSERAGFGLTSSNTPELWAQRLGAGWYLDWRVRERLATERPQHWQMIRLSRGCVYPSKAAIAWLAQRYPGNIWVIGNEPDNPLQDNIFPEEYAQVYHQLYSLIKAADPSAQIAVAGVTQATPLRLAYLDRVLRAYEALYNQPLPADWWTLHGFVLREEQGNWGAGIPTGIFTETSGALYTLEDIDSLPYFQKQITDFRIWMALNGYRDTPLAITEYGILAGQDFGYTPEIVSQYLVDTFEWLAAASDPVIGYPADDGRLVQRWAWFSLYDPLYPTPNLANIDADALTEIGVAFHTTVESWSSER